MQPNIFLFFSFQSRWNRFLRRKVKLDKVFLWRANSQENISTTMKVIFALERHAAELWPSWGDWSNATKLRCNWSALRVPWLADFCPRRKKFQSQLIHKITQNFDYLNWKLDYRDCVKTNPIGQKLSKNANVSDPTSLLLLHSFVYLLKDM